jgi:hypothetical protein
LKSQRGSRLARGLHVTCAVVSTTPMLLFTLVLPTVAGCVIPPSLSVENDAGVTNSPPAIMSITSDQLALAEPGPVFVERGETAGNISVSLIDTDIGDSLFVRIFVDYNLPDRLPPRVACTAAPSTKPQRTATCNMSGLCATADIGVRRNMTVVVFDRRPADFGVDPQAMPEGGLSTDRFYFVQCQLPQTP